MRYIDLFAGIGGFHLGLERSGDNREFLQGTEKSGVQGDLPKPESEQAGLDCNESNKTGGKYLSEQSRKREHLSSGRDLPDVEILPQNKGKRRTQRSFDCVWANEWNKYAAQIYKNNFPGTELSTEDIREVDVKGIPDFDLLCAGFPCQAFSLAGKRKGFEETRGTLFFEIIRIAQEKRPRLLLLENVKGLLSHGKGRTFATILSALDEIGYDVEGELLNSKNFGVPQNRERVFIVGHLRGKSGQKIFPIGEGERVPPKSGEEGIEVKPVLTPDRVKKRQNGRRFKETGEPMFTLTGQDIHGVEITSHSPRTNNPKLGDSGPLRSNNHCFTLDQSPHIVNRIRRLTPTEFERLQGFPDGWTEGISDTQRYKCLGNAVTVNVIEAIGNRIKEVI